jgi:hypothetical protein
VTETRAYQEMFVCWGGTEEGQHYDLELGYEFHDEHVGPEECRWGWACNLCGLRVDDTPCQTHAPLSVPGLRLVDCLAVPRHHLLVVDREDYGHGCPLCWLDDAQAELAPLQAEASKRAHRWCWLLDPLKRLGIKLGLLRWSSVGGDPWHITVKWRWSR